jgi:hypothetical protein
MNRLIGDFFSLLHCGSMAGMKGKFKHWKLFSKHISPAFAKTQERRTEGVCVGCGKNPCECKNPKVKRAG